MPRFRVLILAESADAAADWLGFYATRDHDAASEASAKAIALDAIRADWVNSGGLRVSRTIACWRPMPWQRQMRSGCTFYNDDGKARQEALQIESRAAKTPREIASELA